MEVRKLPRGLVDLDNGGVTLYGSTREFSLEPRVKASSPFSYLELSEKIFLIFFLFIAYGNIDQANLISREEL